MREGVLSPWLAEGFEMQTIEALYRSTFEQLPLGVCHVNCEGGYLKANPAFCGLLGYSEEELLSMYCWDVHSEGETKRIREALFQVSAGGTEKASLKLEFVRKDGTSFWGDVGISLVRDDNGQPLFCVMLIQDMTERIRARQAYRAFVEHSLQGLMILQDEKIDFVNPTLTEMLGLQSENLTGRDLNGFLMQVVFAEDRQKVLSAYRQCIMGEAAEIRQEVRAFCARGEMRWLENLMVRVSYQGKPAVQVVVLDVTQRKQIEKELRKLTRALEESPAIIVITDAAANIEYVNPRFTEVTGYTREEVLGKNPRILKSGLQSADVYRQMWATLTSGKTWRGEFANRDKDGGLFWESASISPLINDGVITHYVAVKEDITKKKAAFLQIQELNRELERRIWERTMALEDQVLRLMQVEKALQESDSRFRGLFDNVDIGVAIYKPCDNGEDFLIVAINDAGMSISRLESRAQVIGKRLMTVFPGAAEMGLLQSLQRVWETGETVRLGEVHYLDDRLDVWVDNNFYKLPSGEVASVFKDITEKKLAEEALQRSEEKYRTVAEFTHDWEYWITPDGNYVYVSPSCERITGYTREQFQSNPNLFIQITHPDDREMVRQHLSMDSIGEVHPAGIMDFRIITRSGEERWLSHTCQPVFDTQGKYLGRRGSNRDITDRKLAAQALQQERESLARKVEERTAELSASNADLSRALRARDEFLATMSHELRSPLNSILSLTEILQEGVYGDLTQQQRKSLQSIGESGKHLLDLINDILDLSKIEAGKLSLAVQTVWVSDISHSSIRLVREQAYKKGVTIDMRLDPEAITLQADARRLKQILVNLLSNAVKFTPRGGKIWLEVEGDLEREAIHFTVRDTGIGISPEDMPRLFKPFVQLDSKLARAYTGTGLGLALVQRMVEMHGGSVRVESEAGKGSAFTVSLPWSGNQDVVVESEEIPSESEFACSEAESRVDEALPHILLVEDSELVITTISDYLRSKGCPVSVARDGYEAIERARELRPALILVDIQMPRMDGLEATRRLRADAELGNSVIVVMSALAMAGDRERCLEAGANDYLSKPVSLKTILSTIEKYTGYEFGRTMPYKESV